MTELDSQHLGRSPLAHENWRYIEKTNLDDFVDQDWGRLNSQRAPYYQERQADAALAMLAAQKDDPSFGYLINNYGHCLQSATMALRDGLDEETVVVTLLHDIGFVVAPAAHAEFAIALFGPYVSDKNIWTVRRHAVFQGLHCRDLPGTDPGAREQWRGHPYFNYAADWVRKYDIGSLDPNYENAPLETFVPMVKRIFSRPPNNIFPVD
ncbi:MAG: phosphohydrolase [Proteobacteria bacterium]|nr:phosphohydrolase [Pseudomonadota bacterium]